MTDKYNEATGVVSEQSTASASLKHWQRAGVDKGTVGQPMRNITAMGGLSATQSGTEVPVLLEGAGEG